MDLPSQLVSRDNSSLLRADVADSAAVLQTDLRAGLSSGEAERRFRSLGQASVPSECPWAHVVRDGQPPRKLLSYLCVPGDLVELRSGVSVRVDGLLVECDGELVVELFGERLEKSVYPSEEQLELPLEELRNVVLSGSTVVRGAAMMLVVSVAPYTCWHEEKIARSSSPTCTLQ